MSLPFKIVKKAGHKDRFVFQDTVIDDFLTAQSLRNFYFMLSGQEHRIGQTYCRDFTRKDSLINECKRLIRLYTEDPDEWDEILERQEKERVEREKREERERMKAKALADRRVLINKKVKELSRLSSKEFSILQAAMTLASANIAADYDYDSDLDYDSEYESD